MLPLITKTLDYLDASMSFVNARIDKLCVSVNSVSIPFFRYMFIGVSCVCVSRKGGWVLVCTCDIVVCQKKKEVG